MLLPNVPGQLPDSLHQILSFSVNDLLHVIKLALYLSLFVDNLLNLLRLDFKFLLLTFEMSRKGDFLFLLLFKFLSNPNLLSSLFLEGTLCFQKLLFLLKGLLHSFSSSKQFFFHSFNFLEKLLLFRFFLVLGLLFLFKFFHKPLLLLLINVSFLSEQFLLSIELSFDLADFIFEILFHLGHFLLIVDVDDLFNDIVSIGINLSHLI